MWEIVQDDAPNVHKHPHFVEKVLSIEQNEKETFLWLVHAR
jgi:hypothetical protein